MSMGTTTKQQKKVPETRFPEFSQEWSEDNIQNLLSEPLTNGEGVTSDERSERVTNYGLVEINNIFESNIVLDLSNVAYINAPKQNASLKEGDVIINRVSIKPTGVGKVVMVRGVPDKIELSFESNMFRVRFGHSEVDSLFFTYFGQTDSYNRQKISKAKTGNQASLSQSDIKEINVVFPKIEEQRKIADFLGSVDAWLDNLRKQKTALEIYKRGMMQKLFTQQVRFKGDGEWVEKQLCDLLDYKQPTQFIVQSTEYDDEYKTPVLTAGKSFILGYTNETEGIFDYELPVIIFDDFTTATQFVDFPFKVKSSAMKILVPLDNNNIKFLYEAMQHIKFEVGGHGRHWISKYSKLTIMVPSPEEQRKIADFAQSLDDLIVAKNEGIRKVEQWKKGLMQRMFV